MQENSPHPQTETHLCLITLMTDKFGPRPHICLKVLNIKHIYFHTLRWFHGRLLSSSCCKSRLDLLLAKLAELLAAFVGIWSLHRPSCCSQPITWSVLHCAVFLLIAGHLTTSWENCPKYRLTCQCVCWETTGTWASIVSFFLMTSETWLQD